MISIHRAVIVTIDEIPVIVSMQRARLYPSVNRSTQKMLDSRAHNIYNIWFKWSFCFAVCVKIAIKKNRTVQGDMFGSSLCHVDWNHCMMRWCSRNRNSKNAVFVSISNDEYSSTLYHIRYEHRDRLKLLINRWSLFFHSAYHPITSWSGTRRLSIDCRLIISFKHCWCCNDGRTHTR